MTNTKTILGAALCGLCAMCGGESSVIPAATSESDLMPVTPVTPINLMLRGDNAGSFTSVALKAQSVHVWADGVPQTVTLTGTHMNLANTGNAWLFATFILPPTAVHVRVQLQLETPGHYVNGTGSGSIDLYELPIVLDVKASQLRARHKLVMHDDLARSFTPEGSGLLFLPDLLIKF